MSAAAILRAAARSATSPIVRSACCVSRPAIRSSVPVSTSFSAFSTSSRRYAGGEHGEETFEEFTARFEKEFDSVQDVFELQRNLNNSFAYDLVPSTTVIVAALKAARRVNDYPTAVRIFEGIRTKVENKSQYEQYLQELEPLRKELGIELKETLYPDLPLTP